MGAGEKLFIVQVGLISANSLGTFLPCFQVILVFSVKGWSCITVQIPFIVMLLGRWVVA